MTELICIGCPKGCLLHVDEENDHAVTGNGCKVGATYGKKELQNPTRTLTSTVCIRGAEIPRLPVKTDREIPKALLLDAMSLLDNIVVQAPIILGDVILQNLLDTGANFVASRSLGLHEEEKHD
ncbi:DUF1667 domain-containing protein [Ruminococcaceae bacterium OttesenSCG-928-I18]|nr:DUF1667 domain-containing protein [Ruminococcaceae bacterium OttesenSCG-928-I18]